MPWKSKAQAAWGHSEDGIEALGGADKVAEWDAASRGMKMPLRMGSTKPGTAPSKPAPSPKGKPSMGGKGNKRG